MCRRGRSQGRCEQAGEWQAAREGNLSGRRVSAWPALTVSLGVRGPLGCYDSFPLENFLTLGRLTGESEVFTRSGQVHDLHRFLPKDVVSPEGSPSQLS